jgi:predicted RecB family nuclease
MPHHDLALLNGLQRKTLEHMRQQGITRLDQLAALPPASLRQFYGIAANAHRIHAQAQAWVQDRAVWYGELAPECFAEAWYFDIETIPLGATAGRVWSIGWSKGSAPTYAVLVAPHHPQRQILLPHDHQITLVRNYAEAWECFAESVGGDDAPLFHWTKFDSGNMRQFAPALFATLGGRMVDLCAAFSRAVQIPRRGVSLKTVAPYLGFAWAAYDDYWLAWQDYQRWLYGGNETELMQLSSYQMDDVLAMVVVRDWLVEQHSNIE